MRTYFNCFSFDLTTHVTKDMLSYVHPHIPKNVLFVAEEACDLGITL